VLRLRSVFDAHLFGDHPYGRSGFPGSGGKISWKASDVLEWHSQLIENKLPLVVVLGDIHGTELAGYFVKHFSSSRFSQYKSQWPPTSPPKETKKVDLTSGKQKGNSAFLMLGPEGENDEAWVILAAMELLSRDLARPTTPPAWGEPETLLAEIDI
jgi:predicted Zn-dependent peptidase